MESANDAALAGEESREAKWRRLIESQAASGLSVKRFCVDHGVAGASFFAWRRNLAGGYARPGEGSACTRPASFIEVSRSRDEPHAAATIELELREERREGTAVTRVLLLRPGFDPALLRAVLAALEAR
jgi:hypothetical protein